LAPLMHNTSTTACDVVSRLQVSLFVPGEFHGVS
jgi:hypothetical protein